MTKTKIMRQSLNVDFDVMKASSPVTDLTAGRLFTDGVDMIPTTGRPSLSSSTVRSSWKSIGTIRMASLLTCLQFSFAMYGTLLLYWSSPAVPDLVMRPDSDFWLPNIGKIFPKSGQAGGGPNQRMVLESGSTTATAMAVSAEAQKLAVCQKEELSFEQKKSNNTKMIEIKTGLFRCVTEFQASTMSPDTSLFLFHFIYNFIKFEQMKFYGKAKHRSRTKLPIKGWTNDLVLSWLLKCEEIFFSFGS